MKLSKFSLPIDSHSNVREEYRSDSQALDYSVHLQQLLEYKTMQQMANETDSNNDCFHIYQTEDTPLNFSLSSSLVDLHSTSHLLPDLSEDDHFLLKPPSKLNKGIKRLAKSSSCILTGNEGETDDNQIINDDHGFDLERETPLMFSRNSTPDSLSSFQINFCDVDPGCGSVSVISEYSCLPSEIVSPSNIPDSPSQEPADQEVASIFEQGNRLKVTQKLSAVSVPELVFDQSEDVKEIKSERSFSDLPPATIECDEDDEGLLADCISRGMRSLSLKDKDKKRIKLDN